MTAIALFIILLLLFFLSPWLIKRKLMTQFQKEKLRLLLLYQIPAELFTLLLILAPVALGYLIFYFSSGDLSRLTELDLPKITIHLPYGLEEINWSEFGLHYSLSGWWNIFFVAAWINLMRYLYKIIYCFKFPYSKSEYSSYLLLIMLMVTMGYFWYLGGAPLYGLAYSIILLAFYTLSHILVCLVIWFLVFLGIERS